MKIPKAFSLHYKKAQKLNKIAQFVILISFLISFIIVRLITHLQKAHFFPNQASSVLHIHHMVPGIILLLISGYLGISFWNNAKVRITTALLFGIGAALTLDEFSLWLFLKDVYWAKQGRDSLDAIIVALIIISLGTLITQIHFSSEKKGKK